MILLINPAASRKIQKQTVIEISPVLFFGKEEYEDFGKHTVLDHYTFNWKDGRMALALGLGMHSVCVPLIRDLFNGSS